MTKFSILRIYVACCLLFIAFIGHCYETETHEKLTQIAFRNSNLVKDEALFKQLGVERTDTFEQAELSTYITDSDIGERSAQFIIRSGATFEDEGSRALNHFFDPYNDGFIYIVGRRSPDWILEDKVADISKQNYSYRDTKAYLYNALTAESEEERNENVVDRDRLVQAVNTQWQGLNGALTQGDIHQALLFLSPSAIDKYRDVFVALQPEFADIVRSYSPMECKDVALGTVSCTIVREKANGQRALHFIQFGQISNGLWKIMDM